MVARILILGPSWLGDAVMAIPAYQDLRRTFPDARIAVLARTQVAGLYRCIPEIDEVLVYRRSPGAARLFGYIRLIGRLREFRPDIAVALPRSFGAGWTALLADANRRVGYRSSGRDFLLTDHVEREARLLTTHRVHYLQHVLTPLGVTPRQAAPRLVPFPAAEDTAEQLLASHPRPSGGPLIAFNPGANYGQAKQWPEERYSSLGRKLLARTDARLVLVGGPGDRDVCDRIHHEIGAQTVLDLSGQTSIPELAAVLRRCRMAVSNDTGAMHVAAAVACPVIAIFGSTDPITTGPFGDGHTVLQEPVPCAPCLLRTCPIDHRCMTRITVERVLSVCEQQLAMEPSVSG